MNYWFKACAPRQGCSIRTGVKLSQKVTNLLTHSEEAIPHFQPIGKATNLTGHVSIWKELDNLLLGSLLTPCPQGSGFEEWCLHSPHSFVIPS